MSRRTAFRLGYANAGLRRAVRYDPAARLKHGRTANLLIVGGSGRGKSYTAKQLAYHTATAGGQVIVLAAHREYKRLAEAVPGSQFVSFRKLSEPQQYRLDPPGMFDNRNARVRHLTAVLNILCDTRTGSDSGRYLRDVVGDALPGEWPLPLLTAMGRTGEAPTEYAHLAERLAEPSAGFLFDTERPPLRLSAPLVVFDFAPFWGPGSSQWAGGVTPSHSAFVYLAVAAAVERCVQESGLTALVVDSADSFARPAYERAWQLVVDHIRYSRYANSAVWVIAQKRGLLGCDRAFRDSYLTEQILFAPHGGSPDGQGDGHGHIEPPRDLETGECLWRDRRGRVRRIRITAASGASHSAAVIQGQGLKLPL